MTGWIVADLRWRGKLACTEEAKESHTTSCPEHCGLVCCWLQCKEVSNLLHYFFGDRQTNSR